MPPLNILSSWNINVKEAEAILKKKNSPDTLILCFLCFYFKNTFTAVIGWCSNSHVWEICEKYYFFRQKVKLDLYQASPYNKTQTWQTQTMTMWLTFITNCNIWREINIAKYGKIFFQWYNFQSLVVSAVPCKLIANTLARVRESRLFLLFSPKNCNYPTYHTTCFIQFETYSVYEVLQMLCSTSSPIKSHL